MNRSRRGLAMQDNRIQTAVPKAGFAGIFVLFLLLNASPGHAQTSKTQQSQQILSPADCSAPLLASAAFQPEVVQVNP